MSPYHTRRTESLLLNGGFSRDQVLVVAPEKLKNFVGSATKIVSITVRDPLSKIYHYPLLDPLSKDSYTSLAFKKIIFSSCLQKYNPKVVLEGPGAL